MMTKTVHNKTTILSQEQIANELAPYSKNTLFKGFQKIWRWWLSVWAYFADKKPALSKFVITFTLFFLISNLVTILQWVLLLFIPYMFGIELAGQVIAWPGTSYTLFGENLSFIIFGYPVLRESGDVIIGGGLGYFYALMIATFIAQCINFPMQRNITYRSKGNPWYQAMWYLIGWLGINLVIWIIIGNIAEWNRAFVGIPREIMDLVNIVIQGGVAMVIFFFIFRIIFPDVHKSADHKEKVAQHKKLLLEEAKQTGDTKKIKFAEKAYHKALKLATKMRALSDIKTAEKNIQSIKSTCESKVIKVISLQKHLDKLKETKENQEEITRIETHLEEAIHAASVAIQERDKVVETNELIIAQSTSYKN